MSPDEEYRTELMQSIAWRMGFYSGVVVGSVATLLPLFLRWI